MDLNEQRREASLRGITWGKNRSCVPLAATAERYRTLGGAGLSVSVHSEHREVAVDYVQYATNGEIQRTLYCDNGDQPGHRSAWLDDSCNAQVDSFFTNTLASHDAAYLQPCYNGFIYMQKTTGTIVTEYLREGGNEGQVLQALDEVYRRSLTGVKPD